MMFERGAKTFGLFAAVVAAICLMVIACSSSNRHTQQNTPGAPEIAPTPTDIWSGVLQRTPYPYTTPLPPATPTALDGIYVKFDPRPGERAPCRRCPPYPPEGGIWRLSLDKGIFRVYHDGTGWSTLGSFIVSEGRIEFFNDPHCFRDVGVYEWKLEDGALLLEAVRDDCGVDLRMQSFAEYPWESCRPPATEAAISGHWPTPVGCDMTLEE